MTSAIYSLCLLVVAAVFIGEANALDCYVCTSCQNVTPDDIQTCSVAPAPETTTMEPVTDQDTVIEAFETMGKQIHDLPVVDSDETEVGPSGFVLDKSDLPGAKFFSRGLKQFRDNASDARCVIAVYTKTNGEPDVVRGCSTASDVQEDRCREAVEGHYPGAITMQYCNLCEEDLCNSAAKSALALCVLIAGVILNLSMY